MDFKKVPKKLVVEIATAAYANCEATRLSNRDNTNQPHHGADMVLQSNSHDNTRKIATFGGWEV